MTQEPPRHPGPTLEGMQRTYHDIAQRTNNAMSALMAELANLDHEHSQRIIQAAIRYADAETTRHVMAKRVQQFKQENGIR